MILFNEESEIYIKNSIYQDYYEKYILLRGSRSAENRKKKRQGKMIEILSYPSTWVTCQSF